MKQKNPLYGYLDHNATTPMRPEVIRVMGEVMEEVPGNPNSLHSWGVDARVHVEKARRRLAKLLGAEKPEELVFTSGGSEADNLALRGIAFHARRQGRGDHLIISAAEHKAVLETAEHLRDCHGFALTILPVDKWARVRPVNLADALRPETVLVSTIFANNEVGTLNPIGELAQLVHEQSGAFFHTDAVQALGKIPVDVRGWGVDLASFGAHKLYGPKGTGALYLREGVELDPQLCGGSQENDRRAGTEDAAGLTAFAEAARLAVEELPEEAARLMEMREKLWAEISARIPGTIRNSPAEECLPNTLNVSFPSIPSREMVGELSRKGFGVSSGSACTSQGGEASHVLEAMGAEDARAGSAIRISLGRTNTEEELEDFVQVAEKIVKEGVASSNN